MSWDDSQCCATTKMMLWGVQCDALALVAKVMKGFQTGPLVMVITKRCCFGSICGKKGVAMVRKRPAVANTSTLVYCHFSEMVLWFFIQNTLHYSCCSSPLCICRGIPGAEWATESTFAACPHSRNSMVRLTKKPYMHSISKAYKESWTQMENSLPAVAISSYLLSSKKKRNRKCSNHCIETKALCMSPSCSNACNAMHIELRKEETLLVSFMF